MNELTRLRNIAYVYIEGMKEKELQIFLDNNLKYKIKRGLKKQRKVQNGNRTKGFK